MDFSLIFKPPNLHFCAPLHGFSSIFQICNFTLTCPLEVDFGVQNHGFWVPKPSQNRWKINKNWYKNQHQNHLKKWLDFWSIFCRFLVDLGTKLGPSWGQVGNKMRKKGCQDDVQKMMPKTKPKKECKPCRSPGSWPLKTIPEPSSKQSQNHQGHYDTPPGPSGPVAD